MLSGCGRLVDVDIVWSGCGRLVDVDIVWSGCGRLVDVDIVWSDCGRLVDVCIKIQYGLCSCWKIILLCALSILKLFDLQILSFLQIFLVSDLIHSELVYQYDLKHGWPRVDKEGNHIKLKLT